MKPTRDVLYRGVAVLGLLTCLGGASWTAWTVWQGMMTGSVRGKHGAVHLRAEGDFFFYSTVTLNGVACLLWLGLAAFAVFVLARWNDWA
ncbi:hypothetical protein [Brevundimonas sp.]|uniref:hypothetical protein n=1 Tax=Brevundimonas sp. TaxID=1871086 RepID=UPI0035613DE5